MNPFELLKHFNNFPFQKMTSDHFSPEYMDDVKKMMKQYQSFFDSDFFETMNQYQGNKDRQPHFPIEILENENFLYLNIVTPGLKDLRNSKLVFKNDREVLLKAKVTPRKTGEALTLIKSELPREVYERKIHLPKPVEETTYSSNYDDGVLTYVLKKKKTHASDFFGF
ncbi:Hsp20 family protein [Aquibacillus salsiterrae]|uniref:Hsp20 family protein n=1 Tax=Aquibacillus salsiterrae TaxID=2950439 RepID=A0A9X3WCN0_9BACI|nr:Hsp20 family protein [Aquibacillus salsiterrae]MDC3417392.1 Hsp20 family protein [Aquibacillus salsiterrae]